MKFVDLNYLVLMWSQSPRAYKCAKRNKSVNVHMRVLKMHIGGGLSNFPQRNEQIR